MKVSHSLAIAVITFSAMQALNISADDFVPAGNTEASMSEQLKWANGGDARSMLLCLWDDMITPGANTERLYCAD